MTRSILIWLLGGLFGLALPDRAVAASFDLAETAASLRLWHGSDGLPSDSVTAILQTRDGFLWVGTSAGLVRFDGATFTTVKLLESPTNNPVWITALCEDSDGCLWIGSQQEGLFQLAQGKVRHLTRAAGLLEDGVTSLAADKLGSVWVGTKSGLNLWSGQALISFAKSDGLGDLFVTGVNVARSGTIWITTRSGMFRFLNGHIVPYEFQTDSQGRRPEYLGVYEDRRGNLWAFGDTYLINLAEGKRFNYFRNSESGSVRIWSLCEGQDGRLWIGTSGRGLYCFADSSFQPVILGENHWSYDVRAICEDHEGDLWLGTAGGGLVELRPQSMQVLQAGQGLPPGLPTALALDAQGRIYAGIHRHGLFVGEGGGFSPFKTDGLAFQDFITSVWAATDGALWAGTWGDGLYALRDGREIHVSTANGLADNSVRAVCGDRQGAVWAGTGAGTVYRFTSQGLTCFDTRQGLPGKPVTVMIPASAGGLWLGLQDGQIFREKNGGFAGIETPMDWGHHPALALHEDDAGRLWIGMAGGGLSCLVNGAMVNWNMSNGLPSDLVAGVVEDPAKNLWMVTGAGIYRVNRADLRDALYHPGASLQCTLMSEARATVESVAVTGGTRALLAPNDELWFATSTGVLNVDTRQSEIAPAAFPVCVESVAFNGQPPISLLEGPLWSPAKGQQSPFIPPQEVSSLVIHSTALEFVAPEELQFRHKLEGSDPDWVSDAEARSVRYGRLPSGNYVFRVAARGAAGGWHEARKPFVFVVPTPLWLQTWALLAYGLAAVGLVTGIVRLVSHRRLRFTLARLEQQQSLERERMRIARDMHDEMGSKLTKISFLSEHAQVDAPPGPLAAKIESIAQTSRELLKTMDEIVWVVNPRNDTLENLANYLSHYAVEYFQNTSINCDLRLPAEIPQVALSSEMRHNLFLTFEEILNNVLKHSQATNVTVAMTVKGLEFELRISDNGKGFVVPAHPATAATHQGGRGGNGLKNMRQRLADHGGQCLIASEPGAGTTVTLLIRLSRQNAGKL